MLTNLWTYTYIFFTYKTVLAMTDPTRRYVTSNIALESRCVYMYKRTILHTMRFKSVMVMNLLKL
jgi:hypothetical protein